MKRILLIITALVFSLSVLSAQQPYRAWSTFGSDTMSYLKTNFVDNKSRYVGKKLEVLLRDYEFPLINTPIVGTSPWIDPQGKSYVNRFCMFYLYPGDINRYMDARRPVYGLNIYFPPPYTQDQYALSNKVFDAGQSKDKIILLIGNFIIQDIQLIALTWESLP